MVALVMLGCGSGSGDARSSAATSQAGLGSPPRAHPQVLEPVAGDGGASTTTTAGAISPPAGLPPEKAPTMPASAGSGPAKGAPTDAEVRAEVARFQLAIAQYHLDRLSLSGALLDLSTLPPGQFNQSVASVFTDYGLPIACGGVLRVPQLGVANKTLPCGTEVIFRYGTRAIRVPVIDRGPYIAGREWDLTGAAAEALHFPGLGLIEWRLG
jgi:Lytic transglycolase